ncbi:MAG: proline--tRNA ligase [Nanoarchaeota archaeon]
MAKNNQKEKDIGITVKKNENFSEWFSQVVSKAELSDIRYGVQGCIVHMPWAIRIIKKMYDKLEEKVEDDEHEPYLFPTLIKQENLLKEKEHAGFTPEVFWITKAGDAKLEEPLALRPTGETQIYPMYSLWLRNHNQLPFKRYQSRHTVFRNEMTTRPFLRGREFLFFETHNMYKNHEDTIVQIKKDLEMMKEVFWDEWKIPFKFFIRPKWDKFLGADNTYVTDTLMPDGKRNQMSSTHDLGINFAKAFNIKFIDENQEEKFAHQSCWGPGIWRLIASIIAIHGDDQGLILPFSLAPYQIVIVPITFSKKPKLTQEILEKTKEIKKILKKTYRVYVDLRSDKSPGFKFNEWEMKGVPIRLEIGPKDLENNQVTVSRRTSNEKIQIKFDELETNIKNSAELFQKEIENKATNYFKDNTRNANTLDEIKKIIKSFRGFVKIPFCSIIDGEECANTIKSETNGAYVCGEEWPTAKETPENSICPICKKPAKKYVFIAKSY